jgi:uncharacterized membrane-anchored protein YhcB (DUF1043 family)
MKDAYYGITEDLTKNIEWLDHQLQELEKHTDHSGQMLINLMRNYALSLRNKAHELKARGEELAR